MKYKTLNQLYAVLYGKLVVSSCVCINCLVFDQISVKRITTGLLYYRFTNNKQMLTCSHAGILLYRLISAVSASWDCSRDFKKKILFSLSSFMWIKSRSPSITSHFKRMVCYFRMLVIHPVFSLDSIRGPVLYLQGTPLGCAPTPLYIIV